ncbi:FAD/NAD(P)-binding domain-containing protein [Melanomma pulvis-pyrius CBS 109.77]|uniref:FAD/NAD(P)-binding domain-containing protein n=1 Tax=Melanomma pulvis-pyrius CBS 109.77 TaxID=1314802 RepID=A0A6A6WWH6_9PLEO|nr:FAD/NAD(P)-binding domain-containing protein [Melanomma pulvis-pyrius CBS 109.77]
MASSPKTELHTLIIGAGTSGLLVAQGLKKAGLPFTIFEQETAQTYQTRPREWGMTLHWGSSHITSCLPPDIVARLPEAYADPGLSPDAVTGLPIHNGKTGELLMEMKAEKPCRVSRKKLRNLFAEGLDIQYGKELDVIRETDSGKVKVLFKDGTEVEGDVVVGCDGARSRVRDEIVGEEDAKLTTVPLTMLNFTAQFESEQALFIRSWNPLFVTSVHPDTGTMFWLSIQDVPDASRPETWTFQVLMSWVNNPLPASEDTYAGRLAFLKRRAEDWAEPWRSAGRWLRDDTKIPLDQGTYWEKAKKWDNRGGKMTLCGDAAHPMTPHRGQGLNNALQDASNFVAAVVEAASGARTLEEAVDAYDGEVLERGTLEMNISLKQTMFIHNWETLMQSPMVKMGMHQAKKEEAKEEKEKGKEKEESEDTKAGADEVAT